MSELKPEQVLKGVQLTEKTAFLAEAKNVYAFDVPLTASKIEIKQAIEQAFEVRVVKVNTQTRVGQPRRFTATPGTARGRW